MTTVPPGGIGWQLRSLREARALTMEDLAGASGAGVSTISELERGRTLHPHRATVRDLAQALGLSGDDLAAFEAAARRGAPARQSGPGPAGPAEPTGLAATSGRATRALPHPPRSFTGRAGEAAGLAAALADPGHAGIHVIEGMAGVGKTALALHAAHQAAGRFPGGQLFIDLHGYTRGLRPVRPGEALRSLLLCLGVPNDVMPRTADQRAQVYRSRLAGTRTLIVLDNAASTEQVRPLLPGEAACPVIVTSRKNLRGLDDAESLGLGTLPEAEAVRLFRAAVGLDRLPAGLRDAARIVRLCEGLPLAIRIVAAWMRRRPLLTAGEVLEELRDEHERLRRFEDDDRSVRVAFELSYRRLPDAEQRLFRRLGLIPGPDFDVAAASSLVPGEDARQLLDSLYDHNLLVQQVSGRYRLHDLVRAYAQILAAAEGAAPAARLLGFYLNAAQAADRHIERRSPGPVRAPRPGAVPAPLRLDTAEGSRAWIAAELANLDAAAQEAARWGHPGWTVLLSLALAQYYRQCGPWPQGFRLHRLALGLARDAGDRPGEAAALVHMGVLQRQLGQLRQARATLAGAAALWREIGDRTGLAVALLDLGVVRRLAGASRDGERDIREALALYQELGDPHGEAGAWVELAGTQRQTSNFEGAVAGLRRALSLYRGLGMPYGEGIALTYLAGVQIQLGDLEPARECLVGALAIYRDRGDLIGEANSLLFLGSVYRRQDQPEEAASVLRQAHDIYAAAGYRHGQAGALAYLGEVHRMAGRPEAADRSLARALALFRAVNDPGGEVETLIHYGELALATDAADQATARFEAAVKLARTIDSPKDEADALYGLGRAQLLGGRVSEARACLTRTISLYQSMGCDADAGRARQALDGIGDDAR